jgi:hypothetical protein
LWLIIRRGGFQIKFCGKSPGLRQAANRYMALKNTLKKIRTQYASLDF